LSDGDVTGQIQMFFDTALSEWFLILMGSEETLIADIFRDILIRLPSDGAHTAKDILASSAHAVLGHALGTITSGIKHVTKTLDYGNDEVIRRFVQSIQTGQAPKDISAQDGLDVVRAMNRVLAHEHT